MPAPLGQQSQLVNPPNTDYVTILVQVLFISLPAPLVGVRMYTRRYVSGKLWWDDCKSSNVTRHHSCILTAA